MHRYTHQSSHINMHTTPRCQCTPTEPQNTLRILTLNVKYNEQQPFHATT